MHPRHNAVPKTRNSRVQITQSDAETRPGRAEHACRVDHSSNVTEGVCRRMRALITARSEMRATVD
jgi:hypothetical protein